MGVWVRADHQSFREERFTCPSLASRSEVSPEPPASRTTPASVIADRGTASTVGRFPSASRSWEEPCSTSGFSIIMLGIDSEMVEYGERLLG